MTNPHQLPIRPVIAVIVLFFVGASACSGCGGCGSDDQLGEVAEQFPADTKVAFGVQSLEELLEVPDAVIDSDHLTDDDRQQWQEALGDIRDDLEERIGIDPGDADAWEQWGIDTEGPIFVGFVDDGPIGCVSVADEGDFQDFLLAPVATELLAIDDPEHQKDEADGHTIHTIGDEVAWAYNDDDAACLAVGIYGDDPIDAVAAFMDGPGDDSLADQPGFDEFADTELPGSLSAIYVSNELDLWDELMMAPQDPTGAMDEFREEIEEMYLGYGSTVAIDDDILRFRVWAGMDDEHRASAREVATPKKDMDWSRFATENTTVAYRASFNPELMWEEFDREFGDLGINPTTAIVEDIEREFDGNLSVEDDLVANLSGHFGYFIYDVDDPEAFLSAGGPDLERGLEMLMVLQFIDADAMDAMLDDIVAVIDAEMPMSIEFRPLEEDDGSEADDIDVLDVPMVGMRLYRSDDLLLVSNAGLSEPEVASFVRGERAGDPISATDAVLGEALEEDAFSGLYLTGDTWDLFEHAVELEGAADPFDEVLVRFDVTDNGVAMDAQFSPAASAVFGIGIPMRQAFVDYLARSKTAEADAMVGVFADGAAAYFEGDQQWSTEEGQEPWHIADPDSRHQLPGMPMAFSDKVFPGGPNVTVKTSEAVPEDGEPVDPEPVIVGDVDFEAEDVLRMLNIAADEPLYFRYTYQTGPGTGDDATATIRAEANFDPSTADHHTVIQELETGDWGVTRIPRYVENELQ